MFRYILEIYGMRCGMCEAHVNNVIRTNFDVKKVKSSHRKNKTIIVSVNKLDEDKLRSIISSTGYELKNISIEE